MNGSIIPPTGNKRGAGCRLFIRQSDAHQNLPQGRIFTGRLVSWILDGESLTIEAVNEVTGQSPKATFNIGHLDTDRKSKFLDGLIIGEEIKLHYEK